ncbi:MAG: hypothetical protein EA409_05740 [Saprospirales bacterium]|nr:MAG: hypothetical protein EA409_05740 [Saprospirales bacterium]
MKLIPFLLHLGTFALFFSSLSAQQRVYDQYIRSNKVGTLSVSWEKDAEQSTKKVRVESNVSVNLLVVRATVDYLGISRFEDGVLKSSEIRILRDGKPHQNATTQKRRGRYLAHIDEERKWIDRAAIHFSSLLLYVKEPKGIEEVYAEADGIFNKLVYCGDGEYELFVKGSRNNYYHYEGGVLVKAVLDHWIAPITLKLRE